MNIRVFLLRNEQNSYAQRLADELGCVFAGFMPENGITEAVSAAGASGVIANAFSDSHVIMFLAEPALYAETKKYMAQLLRLQLSCNMDLFNEAAMRARSAAGERSDFALAHAYMPSGARIFRCGDGLFTGFSVSAGNQTIFLLPLERGRTDMLLGSQVLPVINSSYGTGFMIGAMRYHSADKLAQVCAENDVRIAVAGTNTAAYFRDYVSSSAELTERLVFADKAEKRGNIPPADHVVNLSLTASEFFGTPYGVAISNAFYSGDTPDSEKVIYLAITNEYETAIREVHSVPGEDIPSMLARCCDDLCTFICDVVRSDAAKKELSEKNRKALIKRYKCVIAVVAVLALLIGGFGAYYFTTHDYSLKTWFSDAWTVVFPGSKPIFEEEPLTVSPDETAGETAEETEPADMSEENAQTQSLPEETSTDTPAQTSEQGSETAENTDALTESTTAV